MKPIDRTLVVGVAGMMGVGKSTVARVFEQMGAALIDADGMGKEMLKEPEIRDSVIRAFGGGVVGSGGEVDTAALGRLAFKDRTSAVKLDQITREPLVARIRARIEQLRARARVIVVDAALLPEWDARAWVDVVIVVDCDRQLCERRLEAGQGYSRANAQARMRHQLSRQKKAAYADVVIPNSGSLEELRDRARAVFLALLEPAAGGGK